jgi:ADP-heptose:LPS heptosyltransferase
LTSPQLFPYAKEIIKNPKVKIIYANKRNIVQFFKAISEIKKFNPDLGLNPWSHGSDSEFFISYAKKFSCFKDVINNNKTYNLYDRVRDYLYLPTIKNKRIRNFKLENIKKIVIAPLSTDETKNLSKENLDELITYFKTLKAEIVIASPKDLGYKNQFIFKKSMKNSYQFIKLLYNSDLLISIDSGPLHIGSALQIKTIAIFGPTAPETILDDNVEVKIYRNKKLTGIFCYVKNCKKPICINEMFKDFWQHEIVELNDNVILEENECPL